VEDRKPVVRELFIEELAEVTGGDAGPEPLEKVRYLIRDLLLTTHACGEEVPSTC
jgi:predicted metal-dependent enzyme (double-stranded beta helix superfamily)